MFKKRDQVLVFDSRARKHARSFKLRWIGPCIIKEKVSSRTFNLEDLDGSINSNKVNEKWLKPYYSFGGFRET